MVWCNRRLLNCFNAASSSATFLWDDGSTTDSIYNLGPGTYNVIITVAGCPVLDSAVINEPAKIMFNPTITEISCNSFKMELLF